MTEFKGRLEYWKAITIYPDNKDEGDDIIQGYLFDHKFWPDGELIQTAPCLGICADSSGKEMFVVTTSGNYQLGAKYD